jgi:hypothetical protein
MSGVLQRLNDVRETMQRLRRELDTPNHYFDPNEVNRKVAERIEQAETIKPTNGLPVTGS